MERNNESVTILSLYKTIDHLGSGGLFVLLVRLDLHFVFCDAMICLELGEHDDGVNNDIGNGLIYASLGSTYANGDA